MALLPTLLLATDYSVDNCKLGEPSLCHWGGIGQPQLCGKFCGTSCCVSFKCTKITRWPHQQACIHHFMLLVAAPWRRTQQPELIVWHVWQRDAPHSKEIPHTLRCRGQFSHFGIWYIHWHTWARLWHLQTKWEAHLFLEAWWPAWWRRYICTERDVFSGWSSSKDARHWHSFAKHQNESVKTARHQFKRGVHWPCI